MGRGFESLLDHQRNLIAVRGLSLTAIFLYLHGVSVHNHPSGDAEPSQQDINSTHRLVAASALLNIPVLDHIVIGTGDYKSLVEKNLL